MQELEAVPGTNVTLRRSKRLEGRQNPFLRKQRKRRSLRLAWIQSKLPERLLVQSASNRHKMEDTTTELQTTNSKDFPDVMEAFSNHVIFDKIMTYLDHTSLKLMTETCHTMRNIIRGNRGYLDNSKLIFRNGPNEGVLSPILLQPSDFPWKTLVMDLNGWNQEEFNSLTLLVSQVETIEVYKNDYKTSLTDMVTLLTNLLLNAKNLKHLVLGGGVLDVDGEVVNVFKTNTDLQVNLKNLNSLSIRNDSCSDMYYVTGENFDFVNCVAALCEIPLHLNRFVFDGISHLEEQVNEVNEWLTTVIEKHKRSLISLNINGGNWTSSNLVDIVCPSLKELTVTGKGLDLPSICRFITNQPFLEILDLILENSTPTGRPLLDVLLKRGKELKKFSFKWKFDPARNENLDRANVDVVEDEAERGMEPAPLLPVIPLALQSPPWNFSFLRNFPKLKELRVHQVARPPYTMALNDMDPRSTFGTILSSIPCGIKTINLAGAISGEWAGDTVQATIDSLGQFQFLTALNLIQCPQALNDEILHYLYERFPQLQELQFSHCNEVTDTGLMPADTTSGPSLRNLTCLKKLTIISCPQVTESGCLRAIVMQSLKHLKLIMETASLLMNREFYIDIVHQNPMLETLIIFDNTPNEEYLLNGDTRLLPCLVAELKAVGKRFKTLEYASILLPNLTDEYDEIDHDDGSVSFDGDVQYQLRHDLDFHDEFDDDDDDYYDNDFLGDDDEDDDF